MLPDRVMFNGKHWLAKLTFWTGLAGFGFAIAIPVLAAYYPRYALFQPYASSNYPYRNQSNSNIADILANDPKYTCDRG
jgi:hypothetical protein